VLFIYILLVGLWLSTFYWLPFFGFLLMFQYINVSKNQSRNVKTCYKKFSGLEVSTRQGFGLIGWTICMLKNIRGVVLRNLEDDLFTLFCKWVFTTLEQSGSNIKTLFKFNIIWHWHSWNKKWSLNLNKALTKGRAFTLGSRVWGQAMKTWKFFVDKLQFKPYLWVAFVKRINMVGVKF
jgi:hypothetical protein